MAANAETIFLCLKQDMILVLQHTHTQYVLLISFLPTSHCIRAVANDRVNTRPSGILIDCPKANTGLCDSPALAIVKGTLLDTCKQI